MWRKVLAAILDFLTIFFVAGFAVGYITGGMTPEGGFSLSGGPALVLFAVIAVYFVVFTKYLGGTLWQRVLGTRTPAAAEPGAVINAPAMEKPAMKPKPSMENPSGQVAADVLPAEIPPELDRWNWGALLLNWMWGLGNNTFIALLMFVPVVNIVMPFVLGAKGSQWAWRNKRWRSVEHFRRVQRLWAIWGVVVWIAWIGAMVAIFFTVMESLKHSEAYEMATQRLRGNTEAMEVLGAPISTGYPWGSVEISGPKGRADFSFSVTGAKQKGTVYLDATKDLGRWKINRIELEVSGRAERINLADVPSRTSLDDGLTALKRGDYPTALRLLRSLADQGNAAARFNLATMYDNGRGVPMDDAEAARWYRLAAEQGYAAAQNNLGAMYRSGEGVPQDFAEAVKWFRLAADQGSAVAQNNLGGMYDNGRGVPKSAAEAVKWYRLAAEQGYAAAQNNLGAMYRSGQGVPQDPAEAVKWFQKAADQGSAAAQTNLGSMYRNGEGVPQDFAEAVRWYRLAARQGNASAQNNLGIMYRDGRAVPQDDVRAYMWFNLAAAKGNQTAAKNRDTAAERLTSEQLAQAQDLARKCQASSYKQCD
jgi:TPR repeat protein